VKSNAWSNGLKVTGDGSGVVAHAGSIATRLLADQVGLTAELSGALARRGFTPRHDRGRVLVDLALLIADGGEAISDIEVLRHQSEVLGPVASAPTVWRALDEVTAAGRKRIARARARIRRHVWAQVAARPEGFPASKVADRDLGQVVVIDVDATLVRAHSEKENAEVTWKKTFGFHPLGVWCDNTQELLAATLRPGNAGANTAADHIDVVTEAIAQLPAAYRKNLLVRADGAGATHKFLEWLVEQGRVRGRTVEFSVGFAVTENIRKAITKVPAAVWVPALNPAGELREGGDVAELTGLLDPATMASWPAGMRVIVRRERPHPGAQLDAFEERDGWRYQAFATNTPIGSGGQLGFLEARHRAHARVETRIRHAKASGLERLPSREFEINQNWLTAVAIAADLIAWLRLLALPEGLVECEPKALRYRLLHVPARLTRGQRQQRLRIPATWPWVDQVVATFAAIAAIPDPA
jgi:hypothetical protein